MAYGHTCPVCGARVDESEYSFFFEMCEDCAEYEEKKAKQKATVVHLMSCPCEQMELEV